MFEKEAQNDLSAVTVVTPLCLFAVYSLVVRFQKFRLCYWSGLPTVHGTNTAVKMIAHAHHSE